MYQLFEELKVTVIFIINTKSFYSSFLNNSLSCQLSGAKESRNPQGSGGR